MSVKIKLKHSSTAGKVPTAGDLDAGEVALNTSDVKAYIKNAGGAVVQLAGSGADATKVDKAGDTMTGQLKLIGDPVADADAARKKYVDDQVAAGDFWSRTGTTLSPETAGDALSVDGDVTFGTDGVFYDSTNKRLGVGITSPGALVHISKGSTGETLRLAGDSANLRYLSFTSSDQGAFTGAKWDRDINSAGGTHTWSVNSTERARIDSSGRLLVGTTSAFDVNGSFTHVGTYTQLFRFGAPGHQIILGSANGTQGSPTTLADDDLIGRITFRGRGVNNYLNGAFVAAHVDGTPSGPNNDLPTRLVFSTTPDGSSTPTERMKIDSRGQLIGQSGGTATVDYMFTTVAGASASALASFRRDATLGSLGTGSEVCRIARDGDLLNTNNSYGSLSDLKLKENIVDTPSQWDDLKNLRVRKYNFKQETGSRTHTQIGLVAQEVELVSPGLVSESPDRDEDGNDLGTVTKSVNYSVLYMKAVKALQEAMERIETLEAKVTALEAQ